jgi:hypothetical protein
MGTFLSGIKGKKPRVLGESEEEDEEEDDEEEEDDDDELPPLSEG